MQTFLPLPDMAASIKVLDYRRLGKQRIETKQILFALTGRSTGWRNHPATIMWQGHEYALAHYGVLACLRWRSLGYVDNQLEILQQLARECRREGVRHLPPWFGNPDFHAAHRSNLLRKDPEYYGQFGWQEPSTLPYIWPV